MGSAGKEGITFKGFFRQTVTPICASLARPRHQLLFQLTGGKESLSTSLHISPSQVTRIDVNLVDIC